MRRANAATAAHAEQQAPDDWNDPILVVGTWTYAGTGWRTTADGAVALAAADARPIPTARPHPRRRMT
jgi:hypothetical protein